MRWLVEKWLVRLWNRRAARRRAHVDSRALDLGVRITDGEASGRVTVAQDRRAEHIVVLGKTGTGKSSLLRYFAQQDIESGRGSLSFDLHGDSTEFILACVAERESVLGRDLSDRLIMIEPADPDFSIGMNPLAFQSEAVRFVQVSEFASVLRQRFHLDIFGARTDELLRNSLYSLAESGLTLLELGPLLTHAAFRAACMKKVANAEVRQYFELRYDHALRADAGT